ncbi:29880_t:CDS:2, partial [Racocetra persica]
ILASGGVLALFTTFVEKFKSNKDNIVSLVEVTKNIAAASDKVFMPTLLPIPDEHLNKENLVSRCEEYLYFLKRVNKLIENEKKTAIFDHGMLCNNDDEVWLEFEMIKHLEENNDVNETIKHPEENNDVNETIKHLEEMNF